jgi:hypothetical protein
MQIVGRAFDEGTVLRIGAAFEAATGLSARRPALAEGEAVGRACRCFGSNYRIDPEAVMGDLIQTLDRMQIKPIGRESPHDRTE